VTSYAGLDVSRQETQVCVVDERGAALWAGGVPSEPGALAAALRERAPGLARAVLESGALSGWLCAGLVERGLPALCIDARAAHGALKQRRGKADRGDAEGLARLAQVGRFKAVHVKSRAGLERRALSAARERLVWVRRDLVDQVRGLLKVAGLVPPRTRTRDGGLARPPVSVGTARTGGRRSGRSGRGGAAAPVEPPRRRARACASARRARGRAPRGPSCRRPAPGAAAPGSAARRRA
jgi:hypothetical protein